MIKPQTVQSRQANQASTDTELMESVRDGNTRDLGALFERHNVKLFNHYLRMTGDRHLSEDLTQEVFLRILKYRHTFRGESRFTTWMFTIARNAHMDTVRRSHNERPTEPEIMDELADVSGGNAGAALSTPVHESPDRLYDAGLVRDALQRLSPEKREALILSRYEGMRYAEIAELSGCSVENIKIRVHRALKDLRKIFPELTGEPT